MNKTVIITGGGSGLGLALANHYSTNFNVCLIGRTESKLQQAIETLSQTENRVSYHVCDVADYEQVQSVLHTIFEKETVHLLINNAGTGIFEPLHLLSKDDIEQMIHTNVYGTIYPSKAVFPHFNKQGFGKVMNIISTAGLRGKVNESVYCATKFAVRGFTESLVKEWEGTGIFPTAVYMGGMDTPFWDETDHIKDRSRLKSPETVAKMIFDQDDNRPEIFIDR
ncbi:SDR family NAD(P)-dependent oxidoreductase [Fictibacillus phosphorivorans]|uniref:SDR family NAD(P)-dependent oxidoreductase n=1 Tax=Fictibacillus phosphorivorans TaxID=1221500 RepID=UPI00203F7BF9|nr:SDR family NAD(P)-dependent oxidoreductase [Fictibacillus phosphorivorans]MCM3719985.1 SDR family NAD(P)-dependent oxidoreductase [Fictibacillus phosphorivorans]MCM3777658.1 SDR family NAD(P)-dependent oxidoreductase [Fictibacillus phosphorivorans]